MVFETKKAFFSKSYTLGEDCIIIEQKAKFDLEYKVEFNLRPFHLPPGVSKTFTNQFSMPIALLGVLVFCSAFLFAQSYTDFAKMMMIGLMITGLLVILSSALFRKKTNNVIYYNEDNAYIFELSENGSSPEEFEAFISELNKRIKKTKELSES